MELIALKKGVFLVFKEFAKKLKDMERRILLKFYRRIKRYRMLENKEEEIKKKKEKLKKEIIRIAAAFPGLAGLQTTEDKLRTSVYYTSPIHEFDREILLVSLNDLYSEVVREELILTFSITPQEKQKELIEFLYFFFKGKEHYERLVKEERRLNVNEKKLEALIKEGKIRLPKRTKKLKKDGFWSVKTRSVKKSSD